MMYYYKPNSSKVFHVHGLYNLIQVHQCWLDIYWPGLGFLFARLTKPIRINKDIDQPIFSWCKLTICESGCGHIDFFIGAKYVSP